MREAKKWSELLEEVLPKEKPSPRRRTSIVATRIEAQTYGCLKDIAAEHDRTIAYLVRKAVEQYVETQQKKAQKDKDYE